MGEIFEAYRLLDKTLGLNLTEEQLFVAEGALKRQIADREGFKSDVSGDREKLMAEWEFRGYLTPRKTPIPKDHLGKYRDAKGPEAAS